MILRYVFIKLVDSYANSAARAEVVRETLETLSKCPDVLSVSSGVPSDPLSEKAWDVSITLRFDSQEAVESYRADPIHRKYVSSFLRPRLEVIKAWNFEVTTGS